MRSFGITAKRLQHAPYFIEEPVSNFVSRIRNRLAHLVGGVQPVGVTLADFLSIPKHYLACGLTFEYMMVVYAVQHIRSLHSV